MKRTTIWLNETDRQAIKIIRARYGVDTDSAAIRLALRILASSKVKIDASSQSTQDSTDVCRQAGLQAAAGFLPETDDPAWDVLFDLAEDEENEEDNE